MKKLTCLPILVLIILFVSSPTFSQEPTPGPTKHGYRQQQRGQQMNPEPNTSEERTFPIITSPKSTGIANAVPHNEKSDNDRSQVNDEPSSKWWTIWQFFSVSALIAVGSSQGLFLYLQILHHERIERAYIFVPNVKWKPTTDGAKFHHIGNNIMEVSLLNAGKTPAILNKALVTYALWEQHPTREQIENLKSVMPSNTVIATGESKIGIIDTVLSEDQWAEMAVHKTKLLCYGKIEYADIFSKIHETGFCWECPNPQGGTLAISNNKSLNYYT